MTKNKEVATKNAQIQDLQNQVTELQNQLAEYKYQLKEAVKTIGIYYEITKKGRYEVEDNYDLYQCMICINEGDYKEEIENLNIFAEERGQKVYIVYEKDCGWKIEYKNPNGIAVRLTPYQLFHSPQYSLLDAIDDLE